MKRNILDGNKLFLKIILAIVMLFVSIIIIISTSVFDSTTAASAEGIVITGGPGYIANSERPSLEEMTSDTLVKYVSGLSPVKTSDNYYSFSREYKDSEGNQNNQEHKVFEDFYTEQSPTDILYAFMVRKDTFTKVPDESGNESVSETNQELSISGFSSAASSCYVSASTVVGERWDGSAYSGTLQNIDAAGTYFINSITFSITNSSGSVIDSTVANNVNLIIVLRARMVLDYNALNSLFSANLQFGLDAERRAYGNFSDMKQLLGFYNSGSVSSDRFYMINNGINLISSLSNFGKGNYSASNTDNNDLKKIAERLVFVWKKGADYLEDEKPVNEVGTYAISISNGKNFEYFYDYTASDVTGQREYLFKDDGATPIKLDLVIEVVVGDAKSEFQKNIILEKRTLRVAENAGVLIEREREYDQTVNATTCFSSDFVGVTQQDWVNNYNGVASDYATLTQFFANTDYRILNFEGSIFPSETAGSYDESQAVKMKLDVNSSISPPSSEYTEIMKNYTAVMGYWNDGVFYQLPTVTQNGKSYFELATIKDENNLILFDGNFKIIPNKLSINYIADTQYSYGSYLYNSEFNFNSLIDIKGSIQTPNWKIEIINGTLDINNLPRNASANTIYIGVMTGKKNNEASSENVAYQDVLGNKYTMYDARLYAGEYYFYYDVAAVHKDVSAVYDGRVTMGESGIFSIPDKNGKTVADINMGTLQRLTIRPLELKVIIDSMVTDKYYDGTVTLSEFEARLTGDVINNDDKEFITASLSAHYAGANAGNDITIYPEFLLKYTEKGQALIDNAQSSGIEVSTTTAYKIINSYKLNINEVAGLKESGNISKLDLDFSLIPDEYKDNYPYYKRNYGENNFIVLRVLKRGDILPDGSKAQEDYYYYFENMVNNGVAALSEIPSLLSVADSTYLIKYDLSGFLSGEGFKWTYNYKSSGKTDFMSGMLTDFNSLLIWQDGDTVIGQFTDSNEASDDYYTLLINEQNALNQVLTNYNLINNGDDRICLFIDKLQLKEGFVLIQSDPVNLYREYTANPQIDDMISDSGNIKALFDISSHEEHSYILDKLTNQGKTLSSIVSVLSFNNEAVPQENTDVLTMVLAGQYRLRLNLPASKNYKGAVFESDITISGKKVESLLTFAVRHYKEENPVFNYSVDGYKYVATEQELLLNYGYFITIGTNQTDYTVFAKPYLENGEIVYRKLSDNSELDYDYLLQIASLQYIVFDPNDPETDLNKKEMVNTIIFKGFIGDDCFSIDDSLPVVQFTKDSECDAQANGYQGGIRVTGGIVPNYEIMQGTGALFVLKRALSIKLLYTEQSGVYNGNVLVPEYILLDTEKNLTVEEEREIDAKLRANGIAALDVNIIRYWDETGQEIFVLPDSLLEVGLYRAELKVKVLKEGINYAPSTNVVEIEYTITPMQITFIEEEREKTIEYNGFEYEFGDFDQYFTGNNSKWGSVEICLILQNSEEKQIIKEAGSYTITIKGIIKQTMRKNLYFEIINGQYSYEKEEIITITVKSSQNYKSQLSNLIGTIDGVSHFGINLLDEEGFSYTYCALSYTPKIEFTGLPSGIVLSSAYAIFDADKELTEDIKNAGTYYIKYSVNSVSSETYDKNFYSYEGDEALWFVVIVNKAPLQVNIAFEDGYSAEKTYLDENNVISDHMYLIYSGWAFGEDENTALNLISHPPVIDWGDVRQDTVAGKYPISPVSSEDTMDLINYYFVYDGSQIMFTIKKADPSLTVYGESEQTEDGWIYYNYYIYQGKELIPHVKRRYNNVFINDEIEVLPSDGIKIRCVGLFIGNYADDIGEDNILTDENKIDRNITACQNVGEYIFEISIGKSNNYNAVSPTYYYLKVKKAPLYLSFVGDSDVNNRGYAEKVYDKKESYPSFKVSYEGFVGIDNEELYYTNDFDIYSEFDRNKTTVIDGLNLHHPTYSFTEGTPINIGIYDAYLNEDGISDNYDIIVKYLQEDVETLYPQIKILKRKIDVTATDNRIRKIYDATTKLNKGTVTSDYYSFIPLNGDIDSGLIVGDTVKLNLDYTESHYERANVLDSNGLETVINIRIYGFNIDNDNYELIVTNLYNDNDAKGDYLILHGVISRATAKVDFYDEKGDKITIETIAEYNGEPHPIDINVTGVTLSDNSSQILELGKGYERLYYSASYSSDNPPREAGKYILKVTINDTNYVKKEPYIEMTINKAPVKITFNGDATAFYGERSMGLTAYATGIGGYYQNIAVVYYNESGKYISNIKKADAGVYKAKAIHEETTNFKYQEGETEFTIKHRQVNVQNRVVDSYYYTGGYIYPIFSFDFDNIIYYPDLEFDIKTSGGVFESMNYGDIEDVNNLPKDAGHYRVKPVRYYNNFEIINLETSEFEILPIKLTIVVNDLNINSGETPIFTYHLNGIINGENINNFSKKPQLQFYDNITGDKLEDVPVNAGSYKVIPYGAESVNYIISYHYGILSINKPLIQYGDSDNFSYIFEGSFSANTEVMVRSIANSEFSSYKVMYDTYCVQNEIDKAQSLGGIIYINFDDGSVRTASGDSIKVKITLESIFGANATVENGESYQIAHFKSNGDVDIIEAEVEGDYLVFKTESLEAFSVLTDSEITQEGSKMWVLYMAIGISVLIIGLAILIIKKRA